MEKVSHNGNFSTKTDFKLDNGAHVRIEVWFETECTIANRNTYYKFNFSTKGKGCRNWVYEFTSKNSKDERALNLLTEEQLYTAYFNHWTKLNPIRMFSKGSINGELVNFTVNEKVASTRHFSY